MKQPIVAGATLLAIIASSYVWIKDNGNFATVPYVQEVKAEVIKESDQKYPSKDSFTIVREDIAYIKHRIDQIHTR